MHIGLIGLGVMGRNLALNMRDKGHSVVAWDAWPEARKWSADGIIVTDSVEDLAAALPVPRTILMMVKAGSVVDDTIAGLLPHLVPGDLLVDGGNSFYRDSERRAAALKADGLGFMGIGISGGAEGARAGPSMMVGGTKMHWLRNRDLFEGIAAEVDGEACVAWFGEGGAGHFVKMAHNGIEYAVMQAMAEAYALMTGPGGLTTQQAGAQFENWASGPMGGYLMEITAEILQTTDPETGKDLVDIVADQAGQKGTGAWSAIAGIEYAVPIPAISEAVTARQISALPELRAIIAGHRTQKDKNRPANLSADAVGQALAAAILSALTQGLQLVTAAATENGWETDLAEVAHVWRAGSILRMNLLGLVIMEMSGPSAPKNLMEAAKPNSAMALLEEGWRDAVSMAAQSGIPAPVMSTSLAWWDAMGMTRLPTALIQAQRDRFGRHGFARIDQDGVHHGPWEDPPS